MNIIKLIVDIVLDLIINPIEDIAAPYRRASRRLNQDLAKSPRIPFDIEKSKIIVFSDFHRGAMEKSPVLDRFKLNETVYKEALDYYYKNGFTVVLLGDIEEGWGHNNNMDAIFKSYCRTMHLENQFVISDRYYRVYGNHDDFWAKSKNVDKVINSDMELMEKNKKSII